jgi:hypothetical protein
MIATRVAEVELDVAERMRSRRYRLRNQNHAALPAGAKMTASATLIVVGISLLLGGDWPAVYAVVCIAAGATAWHFAEHARRVRRAAAVSPRLAAARRTLGVIAAFIDIAAVLTVGAYAFDHPEAGLFNGFSLEALVSAAGFGAGLLVAASQLKALSCRLREDTLAWLIPTRGNP